MPRYRAVLIAAALVAAPCVAQERPPEGRLLFTGDILLSRLVHAELERRHQSPWTGFARLFASADWVGGNFEGAIGSAADCAVPEHAPCFATLPAAATTLARAGFRGLTVENNHAGDLGAAGRERTRAEMQQAGIMALDFDRSPQFARIGTAYVAFVAVTTVRAADGTVQQVPSTALAQKLRLARQLASVVVVSIHWGAELIDWTTEPQREQAAWLVDHGADVIVGHHPHVVQPAECIHGKPVFFSLGNHVFDQKYPDTKDGLIADCRIAQGVLRCAGIRTRAATGTAIPVIVDGVADNPVAACAVAIRPSLLQNGFAIRPEPWSAGTSGDGVVLAGWSNGQRRWRTRRQRLLSLQPGLAITGGDHALFTLERHPSSLDGEDAVRPYVYEVGRHGFVARWRGSALAWPLLDAVVMADGTLCALHRGDAFMTLDSTSTSTRVARYKWNGFGFSAAGRDDECAAQFGEAGKRH